MKVLIIRLSSFGDILQTLPAITALHNSGASVSYLTKKNFSSLVRTHPNIHSVLELHGKGSFLDLWSTAREIHQLQFTHIYDAHNNLRSLVLKSLLIIFAIRSLKTYNFLTRSKQRWQRFLFFKLHKPVFKMPFKGAISFLAPLKRWSISYNPNDQTHLFLPLSKNRIPQKPFITLAPSAAWKTKRWPETYWIELIKSCPDQHFVLLGGPEDHFCQRIKDSSPNNTINMAGQLNLIESCHFIKESELLISGDTGLLHAADQLNHPCIALIGPTAFGYPFNKNSTVLEVQLGCKPCSKDGRNPCINKVYQKCLIDVHPKTVRQKIYEILNGVS